MKFLSRLRRLFHRSRLDAEMRAEMAQHLELQVERNLAAGMTPEDARYAAHRQFGNLGRVQEEAREMRGWLWLEQLSQDGRFAVRSLRRNPGYALGTVAILALGIAASTSVFNMIYGVLLAPYPYAKSSEIWAPRLAEAKTERGVRLTLGDYLEMRELPAVDQAMATTVVSARLSGEPFPEHLYTAPVTGSAFPFLGVPPVLGRGLLPTDVGPDGVPLPVAVLSYNLWQQRFNGDPQVIGRELIVDNVPHAIVGVMPPRFGWYGTDSFWRPLGVLDRKIGVNPLLRLKPGVSPEAAEQQLDALFKRLARETPERFPKDGFSVHLDNYLDVTVAHRGMMSTSLHLLWGAVGILLLIACANVANLQFARGAGRAREIAVRAAVGASRVRLFRQLLTESVAVSVVAGLLGIALAHAMTRGVVVLLPPNAVPNEARIEMNGWVLGFAVVVSLATGIMSGLLPCLQGSRPDLNRALKDGGHGSGDRQSSRTRRALVVASVAFSVVLLVAASLAMRSFAEIYRHDWGFRADHLLVLRVPLTPERYTTLEQRQQFAETLLARVQALPDVTAAAIGSLPFNAGESSPFQIAGQSRVEGRRLGGSFVSADFRATFGLRLLAGRDITEAEVARGEPVVLISEALAKLWPAGESPIGRLLEVDALAVKDTPSFLAGRNSNKTLTVVGIVNDTRNANFRADPPPAAYVPFTVRGLGTTQLLVRTKGPPMNLLSQVRAEMRALDSSLPLHRPITVEEIMGQQTVLPKFNLALFGSLAVLALVLAAAGLYSLLAFSVAQRTHEIGVRMALGAERSDVIRLIVGSGGRLVVAGLVLGLGISFAATRLMQNKVFDVPAFDPLAFLAAAGALAAAAIVACLLPARRATKVDPVVALRAE